MLSLYQLFVVSSLLAAPNTTDSTKTTIRFGIDQTYEPFEFVDNGKAKGFNVELIQAIGQSLNYPVKIVPDNWQSVRHKLENTNEINVAAYFENEQRKEQVSFSRPITLVYHSIFTRIDGPAIESIVDISAVHYKVGIQEGTIVEEYFDKLGFVDANQIVKYASEKDVIKKLISGEVDCAITSYLGTAYSTSHSDFKKIRSASDPLFITDYCFVVDKGNEALLNQLNWGIRLVKANGTYDKLYKKWLSPDSILEEYWNAYGVWVSGGLIFLLILVVVWVATLRTRLRIHIKQLDKEYSERERVIDAFKKSERLREKTAGFSAVMTLTLSADSYIKDIPEALHRMLGYAHNEIIDMPLKRYVLPEDYQYYRMASEELQKGTHDSYGLEMRFRTKANEILWLECECSLVNEQGTLSDSGYILLVRDVSPLRIANIKLKELTNELENFMYKTSHDIRGPIANVLGLTYLGKRVSAENDEVMTYFNLIEDSMGKLEHIFNDLKEVSFILREKIEITKVDPEKFVKDILASVFMKAEKDIKKSHIQISNCLFTSYLFTDKKLLKRALYQVLENVFEHNSYYDTEVWLILEEDSRDYIITVADNGVGVPYDIQSKVFEMFFKGSSTGNHVGMGLYLARKAVSRMYGSLTLFSKENEGTIVTMRFPKESFIQKMSVSDEIIAIRN